MQKRILALAAVLVLIASLVPTEAFAADDFLIPDSNIRLLDETELWKWQYDALCFSYYEILARHGFPFDPNGNYYHYFNTQSWYKKDSDFTYSSLNSIEWQNVYQLWKARMDFLSTYTYYALVEQSPQIVLKQYNVPDDFNEYLFEPGQKLDVYTGPGVNYVRADGGKAMLSTDGTVYMLGWEKDWLLVLYRVGESGARIGYMDGKKIVGDIYASNIKFMYKEVLLNRPCGITDDPVSQYEPLVTLQKGDKVTYLCELHNDISWAYVEVKTNEGLIRGCVPFDAIENPY